MKKSRFMKQLLKKLWLAGGLSWDGWLARLEAALTPGAEQRSRRVRLEVEQLEDRLAPATLTWTGLGSTHHWSEAANWALTAGSDADGLPDADDLVVFDGTSSKNATVDAAFGGTVSAVQINSGYTGTAHVYRETDLRRGAQWCLGKCERWERHERW